MKDNKDNDESIEDNVQETFQTAESDTPLIETRTAKVPDSFKFALLAIFIALGPALSISFIWFPYFELLTLTIFIGGGVFALIFGRVKGVLLGITLAVLSPTIYEVIASAIMGPAYIIYPFKIIAFMIIAVTGALLVRQTDKKATFFWRFFLAVVGGLLTLLYDLIVNIGMILFMDLQIASYFATLIMGLSVTAVRVSVNTVLFFFVQDIISRVTFPYVWGKKSKTKLLT
ncbi:MAG: MerC domain-containing protein [Asgard group archaeon]|nr:MerC domain-containing protein [Asgard group archaeon]